MLSISACSTPRWPWSSQDEGVTPSSALRPPDRVYRGTLILGEAVRSFTPCGEDRAIWAIDETGGLLAGIYNELADGGRGAIYAELRGVISPPPEDKAALGYEATISVRELIRADPLGESRGCQDLRPGVDFRAWGNEPFWSIEMGPRTIALRQPDEPTLRIYPPALPNVEKDRIVFNSTSAMNVRDRIRITLEPVPCRDSMSGSYASWSASVEVDGRTLRGCAVQGWGG
jgi:putative lipoprotein